MLIISHIDPSVSVLQTQKDFCPAAVCRTMISDEREREIVRAPQIVLVFQQQWITSRVLALTIHQVVSTHNLKTYELKDS